MKKFKTVTEYLDSLPLASKKILQELRKTIRSAAPDAEEVISYNIPAFKDIIWYAAWKEHISLYPANDPLIAAIPAVSQYVASRGTLKFQIDKPLPFGLITKIVKYRVKEQAKKQATKTSKTKA